MRTCCCRAGTYIDATTAIIASGRGWSKLLIHLDKTLGVSLAFLAERIRKLKLELTKTDTDENESDLMTKALPAPKVDALLPRLGIMSVRALRCIIRGA